MKKILVFRTSTDTTIKRLFHDLGKENIDCLIQSSQWERYKKKYPNINFIDICQEGFYNLPIKIIDMISKKRYDQLYITFSGIRGGNYGNIMEIVEKINFKNAYFYNCNGEKIKIPKKNKIKDLFIRIYIKFISLIYRLKEE